LGLKNGFIELTVEHFYVTFGDPIATLVIEISCR